MAATPEPRRVAQLMLAWLDLDLVSCTELQTLWAGYGHVCAVEARPARRPGPGPPLRLVLKLVCPPDAAAGPDDEGHVRKLLSYEVEQFFYDELAPRLGDDVAVARFLASTRSSPRRDAADGLQNLTATLLSDLRPRFPLAGHRRRPLAPRQVHAAVDWLPRFRRSSWDWLPRHLDGFLGPPLLEAARRRRGCRSEGLWRNGGYAYLATRRGEYRALAADGRSEWAAALCAAAAGPASSPPVAELAAAVLAPRGRPVETCLHGDVKSENLFFTEAGDAVALFDFQYADVGLGVCDLAKLFTCSVPPAMLADVDAAPAELPMGRGERALLRRYRDELLRPRPDKTYDWQDLLRHWETALVDWCRFQASWGFWGNTDWLQARVRCILGDQGWRDWLGQQAAEVDADGAAGCHPVAR